MKEKIKVKLHEGDEYNRLVKRVVDYRMHMIDGKYLSVKEIAEIEKYDEEIIDDILTKNALAWTR